MRCIDSFKKKIFLFAALSFLAITPADACTRVLYTGDENTVITGRSMDWTEDMYSDIWVFPRGMDRSSGGHSRSFSWTSKYGSVITAGYNVASADGVNEKGLAANLLYLAESDYGKPDNSKPILSISLWAQYVLDNFDSVAEAVTELEKNSFQIVAPTIPNGEPAQLHLSLSDPTGDSAIFEYVEGKLVVHHGKEYTVMTNSPYYNQQLALNSYWENIGGTVFLPGTNRAADRFARASFFLNAVPKKIDPNFINAVPEKKFEFQAVASVLSIMRSVSVPLGITTPNQPNIASTLWRTITDHKGLIYYFDSSTSPNVFWIPLAELNFSKGASVLKLKIAGGHYYSGNASGNLVEAKPFEFLPATP
ncbi:MAG: linear amide C-N hydrolase [Parachlamydiales bacterium]|jgi:choloylglycine hydrolase